MATPTVKSPIIDNFLKKMFGADRVESIENNTCSCCRKPANEFRNDLSRKEYTISGMCQACQDSIFGED